MPQPVSEQSAPQKAPLQTHAAPELVDEHAPLPLHAEALPEAVGQSWSHEPPTKSASHTSHVAPPQKPVAVDEAQTSQNSPLQDSEVVAVQTHTPTLLHAPWSAQAEAAHFSMAASAAVGVEHSSPVKSEAHVAQPVPAQYPRTLDSKQEHVRV